MERIGLIAGGGELPIFFANEARKRGAKIIGFAIKEMALPEFDKACDRCHRLSIWQVKKFIFLLLAERIKKIAMLGKVDKSVIYSRTEKDEEAVKILEGSSDRSDYGLLDKITKEFSKLGIEVINGMEYLSDLVPEKGILTKNFPTDSEYEDINFGVRIAREIARLDIGQTVVVKNKAVVTVEAMEGTDDTINRAADICGNGFTVAKVSRPKQDMRWDVPVVGPSTIELIAVKGGKALAIEEKRMFLVDKESSIRIADQNGISIVAV